MAKGIFTACQGLPGEKPLPVLCRELFSRQLESWPALWQAVHTLRSARRREISGMGMVQYNPGRTGSAEARIDAASIEKRPCFLCMDHLPPEQEAVLYRQSYAVLCNPFPIFLPHFTIVHLEHRPQLIGASADDFLELARDLSPEFSVFYNGPRCGASAPDHLHFQGYPTGGIPVDQLRPAICGTPVKISDDVSLWTGLHQSRHYLYLDGHEFSAMRAALQEVIAVLETLMDGPGEAMMNLIASYLDDRWRVFVFPRNRHRPEAFFREGDDRRVITPGAVEMGGLVVTINERDFVTLDDKQLQEIFTEVSVDREMMDRITAYLSRGHDV